MTLDVTREPPFGGSEVRGPALDCAVDTDSPVRGRERVHIDRNHQGGVGKGECGSQRD